MKLYLLRHGDAQYKALSGKDFDRSLSPSGKKEIEQVKEFFIEKEKDKEFSVYCSSAQRTKETFQILSSGLKMKKSAYFDELYHADFQFLMEFLSALNTSEEEVVLLVGHNNGISDLASYLLDQRIGLPTGGLMVINFTVINNWSEIGKGTGEEANRFSPWDE